MQWYASTPGAFYDCDEATVVYFHPPSGNTHLVSDFAAYLIRQLALEPMTVEQIAGQLAPIVAPHDHQGVANALPDLLDDLARLDIIEQV